nr:GNAT family protein [Corynebacterium caspium]
MLPRDWHSAHTPSAWWQYFQALRSAAFKGLVLPLAIEVDGHFAGQLTLDNVQRGAVSGCEIGYWVYSAVAGRGIGTAACSLGVDHAFGRVGVHRISATYMPENRASGKILRANGFREEGYLQRNLLIDGQWRDHILMAITLD